MNAQPIIFSAASVRAILAGRKTQTRRIITPQPAPMADELHDELAADAPLWNGTLFPPAQCSYGKPGDRLWIKETIEHAVHGIACLTGCAALPDTGIAIPPSHSAIVIPLAHPRTLLEIVEIRIQRLQAMSPDDAIAEGIEAIEATESEPYAPYVLSVPYDLSPPCERPRIMWRNYHPAKSAPPFRNPVDSYRTLWDTHHAASAHRWSANPWVRVVEFRATPAPSQDASPVAHAARVLLAAARRKHRTAPRPFQENKVKQKKTPPRTRTP